MKYKGINRNVPKAEMPDGYGVDAKNGVNSKLLGASINEGGWKVWQKAGVAAERKFGLPVTYGAYTCVRRLIGEVEVDLNRFVLISLGYHTDTVTGIGIVFCEIGILQNDGEYISIMNDLQFNASNKLGFTAAYPVTGEYTKTNLNELIIILTDTVLTPYYINMDYYIAHPAGISFSLNEIRMFPDINQIKTVWQVNDTGGTLANGIYYFSYGYVNSDMSVTNAILTSNPITVYDLPIGNSSTTYTQVEGDLELVNTNKSITLSLSNLNTAFKELQIYAIIKRNNISTAVQLNKVSITGTSMSVTISSSDGTDISLAELLTPRAVFKKVFKFTQVYNRLYSARPTYSQLRSFQKYANLIQIKWHSLIVSPYADAISAKSSAISKSFLHKEVYAFNVHLCLTDGTVTEGFHIPWIWLDEAGIIASTYRDIPNSASAQGLSLKRFQIEDTVVTTATSTIQLEGKMGFWENQDELYPNTDDYNSNGIGGEDLRGRKVRHHRFPSIRKVAEVYHTLGVTTYGTTLLDMLGIDVSNVIIPNDLKPFVKSWFISYAQRSANESTVLGQSMLQFESTALANFSPTAYYGDANKSVWSSGLNTVWANKVAGGGYNWFVQPITPYTLNADINYDCTETIVRFYDQNLLKNQPDIAPVYLSNELFYDTAATFSNIYGCDGSVGATDTNSNRAAFGTSYIDGVAGATSVHVNSGMTIDGVDIRYRNVKTYKYLPNQVNDGRYLNSVNEDTLILELNSDIAAGEVTMGTPRYLYTGGTPIPPVASFIDGDWVMVFNTNLATHGNVYERVAGVLDATTYRGNRLKGIRSLPINTYVAGVNRFISWWNKGDTYPDWNVYPIQTYLSTLMGNPSNLYRLKTQILVNTGEITDVNTTICTTYCGDGFITFNSVHTAGLGGTRNTKLYTPADEPLHGLRTLLIHLVESQINNTIRSNDPLVITKQSYPKYGNTYWMSILRNVIETNKLYNNDYTSINNIIPLEPYNADKTVPVENYYKINRTIAPNSESSDVGWRTWLINDYYEAPRNKGKIINIEGEDRDLIVQMEKATFKTVGNEQISIDRSTAFIGAGNIFERPAIEFIPSKEGTFGTQHRFSCKLTRFGYISIDMEACKITVIKGVNPIHISDDTMYRWLIDELKINNIKYNSTKSSAMTVYNDNPYFGVGVHVGVDYEFERFFITKQDYEIPDATWSLMTATVITYIAGRWFYTDLINNTITEINPFDSTYFTNKSWTICFEVNSNAFTFFQDYIPNKYINDRLNSFVFKTKVLGIGQSATTRLYQMNQSNKGIYDNTSIVDISNIGNADSATPYPFYIVPVFATKVTAQLIGLTFVNEVVKAGIAQGSLAFYQQVTVDNIHIFNSYQSTQVQSTVVYADNMTNFFNYNIRKIKGVWHFNRIFDMLALSNYNSGTTFITDYSVLDTNKIDATKAFYNKLPLIDSWVAVKISFNNTIVDNISKEFRILQVDISVLPVSR